jgi:hypothetical protein
MSLPESPNPFEICSSCGQRTAAQFFRTVNKVKLCVLCAQRADDAEASLRGLVEDHRLHGGMGWLWKHIAYVAYVTIGWIIVRFLFKSLLLHL